MIFQLIASGIQSLFSAGAIVVGDIWTYQRFIQQRDNYPHIDFSADMNFIGQQDGFWIVELIAWIENKGKVQHRISDFKFDLFALYDGDPLNTSDDFGGQVYFPHAISKGAWLPKKWDYTFIEPGIN